MYKNFRSDLKYVRLAPIGLKFWDQAFLDLEIPKMQSIRPNSFQENSTSPFGALRHLFSFVYQKAPKTKAMRVPTFIPNWSQLSTKRHEHLKNCLKTRFLDGSVPKALPRSASRAVYPELLIDFWQFWDPHRDPKIDQKRILIQNPDAGNRFFTGF